MLKKEDTKYFKDLLSRILGELSDKERTMTGLHLRGEKRSDLIDAAEEEFEGFLSVLSMRQNLSESR